MSSSGAGDDPEERDPGLALERTALAWTRTAISFAGLGAAVLKSNWISGLVILAVVPVVWQLGRVTRGREEQAEDGRAQDAPRARGPAARLPAVGAARLFAIAATIVAVAVLCLIVAVWGKSVPGALG